MAEDPKKALGEFAENLEQFSVRASKLLGAWEKLERTGTDLGADMAINYPFHKSFDELLLDIYDWKHTVDRMVKQGWPGPREWLPGRKRKD